MLMRKYPNKLENCGSFHNFNNSFIDNTSNDDFIIDDTITTITNKNLTQQEKDIYKIIDFFDIKYNQIKTISYKLKYSIDQEKYYLLFDTSKELINSIDELFLVYRKLRKLFNRIGFEKITTMEKVSIIPDTICKIGNIYSLLLDIKNTNNFIVNIFHIEKICGYKILDIYIKKTNDIMEGCDKWTERFYQ